MTTRIKVQHTTQPAAADAMKTYNISNDDWYATPRKVREILLELLAIHKKTKTAPDKKQIK